MTDEINVTIGTQAINVTVPTDTISVTLSGGVNSNTFVAEGGKIYLDGFEGDSYLWINPATGRLEVVHEGVTQQGWGS